MSRVRDVLDNLRLNVRDLVQILVNEVSVEEIDSVIDEHHARGWLPNDAYVILKGLPPNVRKIINIAYLLSFTIGKALTELNVSSNIREALVLLTPVFGLSACIGITGDYSLADMTPAELLYSILSRLHSSFKS